MNKALLTGGTGFIGRHLCESLLADGWAVQVVRLTANASGEHLTQVQRLGSPHGFWVTQHDNGAAGVLVQQFGQDRGAVTGCPAARVVRHVNQDDRALGRGHSVYGTVRLRAIIPVHVLY